jgi:uncharacterized repeat protein (TIGR04076 family)
MFKVKATVIGYDKDEKRNPCHFRYSIGDEIDYDGETISGRICPAVLPALAQAFKDLQSSGGRHKEGEIPGSYYPFWYSPLSNYDPAYKKYDGVGFRPTLERPEEDYKFIPDETLYDIPPGGVCNTGKGTEKMAIEFICPDAKTYVRFKVEAIDLSDKGDGLPYFRRTMSILNKIIPKPDIAMGRILDEFSEDEKFIPYPTLGHKMIAVLVGELELMGYVEVKDDKVTATDKGLKKMEDFKASLTAEEREALNI